MKFGVFLPISGRAAGPATLTEAARQAETLGYDSVWAADRIVIPWEIKTPYPYSEGQQFIVPPDRPFFEPLTCLAFLAGCTEKVKLGMSVLVLPYRHPLYTVPQNAPHVSAGMNPVPTPPSENDAFPTQHGWNGVNVWSCPKGSARKPRT